jgi:hypothetical protein
MDIYDRVAAWATAYALENHDLMSKTGECISWAVTLNPFIKLALDQIGTRIDVPEAVHEITDMVENVGEYSDRKDAAEYAETVNEWLTGPDQSVEIGGARVDAEIEEIKELQKKQEEARAEQADKMTALRDNLAEKYEGSPDQEKHLEQFKKAADAAQKMLADQQAAERQRLQEQQLQRPDPPDPNRDR